jgi:DNA-directed RNA polymerase subunit M/transcription elongation factor TFIIS
MNRSRPSALGHCPYCGGRIPEAYTLIEYERSNDEPGVFAECPDCGEVVRPE